MTNELIKNKESHNNYIKGQSSRKKILEILLKNSESNYNPGD